jgi:hypothetical protein
MSSTAALQETLTLSQAKSLIKAMAHRQSLLLLSPPGMGKSDTVFQAAKEAGLPCRSLLGTQIAPEDVSGIPRIVGERSVFCPPRLLLPEDSGPFCLFLDELPACAPDIQKAFYSLLLERRLGEHPLPEGTWVVAAGNRAEDRALVRAMSSALINRVIILNIRGDVGEWLAWAGTHSIRPEVIAFIGAMPEALMRPVPAAPLPFSTPRSWAALSQALDSAESAGVLDRATRRALAFGSVFPEDAAVFCTMVEVELSELRPIRDYILDPALLPEKPSARWFILSRLRSTVANGELNGVSPQQINAFLQEIPRDHLLSLFINLVQEWGALGAEETMRDVLEEVTGL